MSEIRYPNLDVEAILKSLHSDCPPGKCICLEKYQELAEKIKPIVIDLAEKWGSVCPPHILIFLALKPALIDDFMSALCALLSTASIEGFLVGEHHQKTISQVDELEDLLKKSGRVQ